MAYPLLVCVDPEEQAITPDNYMVCNQDRRDRTVRELARRWPQSTICIFQLDELQKISVQPVYAKYKVNLHGEIVPA